MDQIKIGKFIAKNSDSQRRKAYAWKYLRAFLVASIILKAANKF